MGVNIVAVAVLLAISVKPAVMMHKTSTRITGSKSLNDVKASPISADRPDFCGLKQKKYQELRMKKRSYKTMLFICGGITEKTRVSLVMIV